MKFNDFVFDFSKSCCGSHSGNISACASTCRKHCGHPILAKLCRFNFSHIFPMVFQCFYVSAIRRRVGEVAKVATELSQHEALKGVHVLKTILCVTFCAPRFGIHFNGLAPCTNYTTIHMFSGTHVRQTALHVTFGVRRRSIPVGLLDNLLGDLGHGRCPEAAQGRPWTLKRLGLATVWTANSAQRCNLDLAATRLPLQPEISSGKIRRRERHAHEVA